MNTDRKLNLMRTLYMALQVETMANYEKGNDLASVIEEKRQKNLTGGSVSAKMLGITRPEEAFTVPSALVECAGWELTPRGNGFTAICVGCQLAGMCKAKGTPSPCRLYCLNPIEGMIKSLEPDATFQVVSTLWDAQKCEIDIYRA